MRDQGNAAPELTVVVPTFEEVGNVEKLLQALDSALVGIDWEVIIVDDDSQDGTPELVHKIARKDGRVRLIQRFNQKGLSSACIEGMLSTSADYVAVMDGDLQHDETLLPKMVDLLRGGDVDIVVGSRYTEGGGIGEWKKSRVKISSFATRLSRFVLKADLSDPMSGFFMMRHDAMLASVGGASGIGFKILLDLFSSSPKPLRYKELPFHFRQRNAGESKLDSIVVWEYMMLLLDKMFGKTVPIRFIAFSLIGGFGVLVHLAALSVVYQFMGFSFFTGQATATLIAMTSNFFLNNMLTYRDMRLTGWGLLRGWVSFSIACSVGALANIGIADFLFEQNTFWVTSAVAGVLVGAVWNYAVTAVYTWRKPRSTRSKK